MQHSIYLISILFVALSCTSKQEMTNDHSASALIISETVDAKQFQAKVKNATNAIILDVRTPGELSDGFIEGAKNIDYNAADFQSKINELDKSGTYFVYCAGGGRSRNTADLMKQLNFKEVYDLQGGISQWKADGLPIKVP